ncbi:MAG: PD40 domain-containing protein [Thermoleophilia bacterium]|nr:PD40 domain-containing protein [Thermoleophilia bacterium]
MSAVRAIVLGVLVAALAPACGGSGGGEEEIVFVLPEGGRATTATAVFVTDPAGERDARRLTSPPEGESDSEPAWSPDGSQVVFVRRGRESRVLVVGRDGGEPDAILPAGTYSSPSWSPDGERIAYFEQSADGWDVMVARADGSGRRRLVDLPNDPAGVGPVVGGLDWGPDGSLAVAYAPVAQAGQDLEYELYVAGEDGETGERLAPGTNPSWSPDGGRIAFETAEGISIVARDGTGRRTLLEGNVLRPDWSPDGERIVFTDGALRLTVVEVDGDGERTLVRRGADPDWGRAGD